MKILVSISLFLAFGFSALAQGDDLVISVEGSGGLSNFQMAYLNESFIEEYAIPNGYLDNTIEDGYHGYFGAKVILDEVLGFGPYIMLNGAEATGTPEGGEYDNNGNMISEDADEYIFKVSSLVLGTSASLYLNDLMDMPDSDSRFMRNLSIVYELGLGIGFSQARSQMKTIGNSQNQTYVYKSYDMQGQTFLLVEYPFLDEDLIGLIGFKGGYQYLRTLEMENSENTYGDVYGSYSSSLDFSGLFAGISLRFEFE